MVSSAGIGRKGTGYISVMRRVGSRSGRLRAGLLALAALAAGCDEFRGEGPEDPSPVVPPRLVSVTVEYRQPNECFASSGCEDLVVFAASWMPLGQGLFLERAAPHVWRANVPAVPVNFPPRDDPHAVVVYDPHLRDTPSQGFTAIRLRVGGQILTVVDSEGTPEERGLIYVDENGFGHNPF